MLRSLASLPVGLLLAAVAPAQPPALSPFDLLQRVREAYLVLDAYRDHGEIERSPGGGEAEGERFAFTTELGEEGAFRFELRPLAAGADGGALVWSRGARTLPAEIEARLGAGARDALPVAALLAGGSRALPDPELLALDGEEPCDGSTCLRLVGAHDGGARRFTLWIDAASLRIRRAQVELDDGSGGFESTLVATIRPDLALEGSRATTAAAAELPVFSDRVDVALASIAVRVLDRRTGEIGRGLEETDFELRVGGRELPIEAVEWVSSHEPIADAETLDALAAAGFEAPSPGKLVVFFVQADLRPSRMIGQMRTLPEAKRFLDTLGLEDRVAVVSFDSHLKLRQDFTLDRARVRAAFDEAMLVGPEPRIRAGREPSLARHLDFAAAREAAVPESGLEATARALEPLPGEKVVVFVGWGLGRLGPMGVDMIPEYRGALDALARARASVFALDVTDADYHSLEEGLKRIARDTGGRYLKTTYHPAAALDRLADLVSGLYRITFRPPDGGDGGDVRVALRDRRLGEVVVSRIRLGG